MLKLVPALHEDPKSLYDKANLYFVKGCMDIAESLYHKVLNLSESGVKISPELKADILHNLGMISERRHNLRAAIKFYRQAVRNDKQHSMTWLFLAKVYLERYEKLGNKQDHQAGFRALNKAAEFKPEYPVIRILKERFSQEQ
ncbi:MAG: tetratricopeptide repeat protein [Firmicutes bacterium]|nr:tetratricopeptide repeat protein [Bacillota bacterium]